MKLTAFPLVFVLMALGPQGADASTAYGDLNNFDTVNDTGHECHGFEIEIEGAHSTDITYTYDWNHYGHPSITDDNSDPAHPRVFIRYASAKKADGTWAAFTAIPAAPLSPTDGHSCTNPNVNYGCEHFGVGYYGNPTAIRYHWLYDDGSGNLVPSQPVLVATPSWTYEPPAAGAPAVVVAAIPAPVVPIPVAKKFGEASWVKVIKTTVHNANDIALADLISDDPDGDGKAQWQNAEPAEVETEFMLLQANSVPDDAKDELIGAGDDMGDDGSETVTRRYEFYKYAGDATTIDGETDEAMCDEVDLATNPDDPQYLHGLRSNVGVTDANGDTQYIDCTAQVVVGDYIGAQMAGFEAAMPLGLIDHLQDGEQLVDYTPRAVVVGGNSPYDIALTGNLPPGLVLGDYFDPASNKTMHGVLSGIPQSGGTFNFTVQATDANGVVVNQAYTLNVAGDIVITPQYRLSVAKLGSGTGSVAGDGIDCGATCEAMRDAGTTATLTATAASGSVFSGWDGACTGTLSCVTVVNADTVVTATFTQQYQLTVSKAGSGAGSVSGNGIDCGGTCNVALDMGTAVSLTATPASGSVFSSWSGDCTGTGVCNTTMSAARNVIANFNPAPLKYTLTVRRIGLGTVTSSPRGISCGTQCTRTFATGSKVTLTAKPAKNLLFSGWSGGGCSGTALTCVVPMTSNQTVTATFK